jgi:hypothetical protein
MEWLYGSPEQGDSEALATWTSVQVPFTAPFLLFACMICFNFVIACWLQLYCFNVDVFVFFFIFGKKLSRTYVFDCLYYMRNWNKILLTYFVCEEIAREIDNYVPFSNSNRGATQTWRMIQKVSWDENKFKLYTLRVKMWINIKTERLLTIKCDENTQI